MALRVEAPVVTTSSMMATRAPRLFDPLDPLLRPMTLRFLPDAKGPDRHPLKGTMIGDRARDRVCAKGQPSDRVDMITIPSFHCLDPLEKEASQKWHGLRHEGRLLAVDIVPALPAGSQGEDRVGVLLERMPDKQFQEPFARILHGVRIHERLAGCPAGFSTREQR